jgi:hypothetical protein
MQAILLEVKKVKNQSVDRGQVDKLIEKKTDQSEFEKMVEALSGSLENLRDYVEALNMANNRTAAALRSKCLVCDKTIDPIAALAELEENARQLMSSKKKTNKSFNRRGPVSVGYGKSEDPMLSLARPHTIQSMVGSRSTAIMPGNNQSSIEFNSNVLIVDGINSDSIQRNIVELNPIDHRPSSPSGGSSPKKTETRTINIPDPSISVMSSSKSRVKSAVGGGVAPKKTTDNTR